MRIVDNALPTRKRSPSDYPLVVVRRRRLREVLTVDHSLVSVSNTSGVS